MGSLALAALLLCTCCTFVVSATSRLREQPLVLPGLVANSNMMGSTDVPVDPHGDPRRLAGYFRLNRTQEAEMFYFYFESRNDPANDPVVLWMTENGPFSINPDLTLNETRWGWDVGHNLIFVDQPIGTGFSYSNDPDDSVYSEVGVAHDMLDFVREFLEAHPELADNDLFVTGESYAGHYVPAVAHRLWKWNNDNPDSPQINFKGLAIGNGLTDPEIQYGAYGDFALQNGLIGKTVYNRIQMAYPACKYAIDMCNAHNWAMECTAALSYCQAAIFGQILLAAGGVNVYDIRKQCEGPLCYDFSLLERYLSQPAVREALGVGNRQWSTCDRTVYSQMLGDWMKNYDPLLPEMLAGGVRVMIYAGAEDLICNWLGNRRWVDALKWERADDWTDASDYDWTDDDGDVAGHVKSVGPLTFVKVLNAGHMVPMDVPRNALDMLTRFTSDKGFGSSSDILRTRLGSRKSDPGSRLSHQTIA